MAQATTDLSESPLRPTDIEANPYKRPTINRRHRRKRPFGEWWSILPLPYKFFILLIAISVVLVFGLYVKKWVNNDANQTIRNRKSVPNPELPLPPSRSALHLFKDGAVCSDAAICSKIGKRILEKSENVADSALATLFCNGILTMQSMGIGGGFLMNIYKHKEKKAFSLNAKESCPDAANDGLYKDPRDTILGPLSIGIPGEVKGYWELHKLFGSLPWNELIEPSIELCEQGFILTKHMADTLEPHLLNDTNFKNTFYNNVTGQFHKAGEHILPPQQLCSTYKRLAAKGGDDYYNGELAQDILADLKDLGALVSQDDLETYKVRWSDSISVPIYDNNVWVTPPPSNGLLVAFILNVLKGYNFTSDSISTLDKEALTLHRYTEALKFAFGKRTLFGDPDFINVDELVKELTSVEYAESIRKKIDDTKAYQTFDHYGAEFTNKTEYGTSHVSVVGANGDAVSVTSSINYYYGAGLIGPRTGIIFNSGMNDFAVPAFPNLFQLPPSSNNFMAPHKRAVSSMSPTIITGQDGGVRLVIGAAGGSKIVSGVSSVALRTLYFQQNIKEAIDAPRLHHQVSPMELEYEYGNTQPLIDKLAAFGHKMVRFDYRGAVVCAISRNATGVYANADYRKAGEVEGL